MLKNRNSYIIWITKNIICTIDFYFTQTEQRLLCFISIYKRNLTCSKLLPFHLNIASLALEQNQHYSFTIQIFAETFLILQIAKRPAIL